MLKTLDLLFGIITINIILFPANLSISIYAQDTQYYYNTKENNSSHLNELKIIKAILNQSNKMSYSSTNC